jgi:hypothetical protein
MFESMNIAIGLLFGLAGLGVAVLLGLTLYKDKPREAPHRQRGVGAPVRKTA